MNLSFDMDCKEHKDSMSSLSKSRLPNETQGEAIMRDHPHEKSKEEIERVWHNYIKHKDSPCYNLLKGMGYIHFENPEQIDNRLLAYAEKIISIGDWAGKCCLNNANEHYQYWRLFLAHPIPVCFVTRKMMPKPVFDEDFSMEALGCYFSRHPDTSYPRIYLCPETIKETSEKLSISEDILYAIVLIHEYAHAAMDPTNELSKDGNFEKKGKQELREMESFIEESLANMLTLQYFEVAGDKDFQQAKSFMEKQPDAYRFGINQYELGTDWRDWRNNKSAFHFLLQWANAMKKTK